MRTWKVAMIAVSAASLVACSDRGAGDARQGDASTAQGGERSASSAQGGSTATSQQGQTSAGASVVGQVVSAKKDELVLKEQGADKELKLKVDDSTRVTLDGRETSIDSLREGAQVRASYDAREGEPRATRIEATSSGESGGAASKGDQPGGSAGTTGGLGGSSSHTPGQMGGPGGDDATSAGEPNSPRGSSGTSGTQSGKR